ncbi:MAG: DUF2079 domain-containing protein [Candidatus Omnitrophota bacterium]|jgi:uncharacterized membrane protein
MNDEKIKHRQNMTKPESAFEAKAPFIVACLIISYIALFFVICLIKYLYFGYFDFDLAIYNQSMWNTLHGRFLDSSIARGIIFTDHFSPILIIYLVFYAIIPHAMTLLLLQSALLGAGAWPVYLIAKEKIGKIPGVIIAFAYLVYPALNHANLFEFHPEAALAPIILFMFYCLIKDRFVPFVFLSILALSCKEDAALAVIMFGIYAMFARKSKRWILWPIISSLVWSVATIQFILPYFNKDAYIFTSFYAYLGNNPVEIAFNIVRHPIAVLKIAAMPYKIDYLRFLFSPVSFLPLFSPAVLFLSLPTFARNLLADYLPACNIYNQYNLAIIPVIFLSSVYGIRRLLALGLIKKMRFVFAAIFVVVSLYFAYCIGPWLELSNNLPSYVRDPLAPVMNDMIRSIPSDAGVVATFRFLPKLSGREQLQSFHHLYMGHYKIINKKYTLPPGVEYALIDFEDTLTAQFKNPESGRNFRSFLEEGHWGVVGLVENTALLKKGSSGDLKLYEELKEASPSYTAAVEINREIALTGYDLSEESLLSKKCLSLSLYWKSLKAPTASYGAVIWVEDPGGQMIRQFVFSPAYNIYPTEEWPAGRIIKTNYRIFIPSVPEKGRYKIKMGFFDKNNGPVFITCADKNSIDSEKRFLLGEFGL